MASIDGDIVRIVSTIRMKGGLWRGVERAGEIEYRHTQGQSNGVKRYDGALMIADQKKSAIK